LVEVKEEKWYDKVFQFFRNLFKKSKWWWNGWFLVKM
jgi:hypothetical protein